MNPEDIRKLYDQEDAATGEEAAATAAEVAQDPEMARALWVTLLTLMQEDPFFAVVYGATISLLGDPLRQLITERMATDDTFALAVARAMLDAQRRVLRGSAARVQRGKDKGRGPTIA